MRPIQSELQIYFLNHRIITVNLETTVPKCIIEVFFSFFIIIFPLKCTALHLPTLIFACCLLLPRSFPSLLNSSGLVKCRVALLQSFVSLL